MSSISGKIVDQRNSMPIEGVSVTVDGQGAKKTTSSGGDGSFAIDGLSDGAYELVAQKQGYSPGVYGPLTVIDGAGVDLSLALPPELD